MRWFKRKSKAPQVPAKQPSSAHEDEKKPVTEETSPSPSPPSQHALPPPQPRPQPVQPQTVQSQPAQPAQTSPTDGLASPQPGNAPLGLDVTMNEEITATWMQVQDRVKQLAAREGKEVNEGLGIGDLIANLDASQEKEEESPKTQAIKTAFGRTLGLIKTVGGIVSDGASSVFAPAGQCFNAISFVINAWDGYNGAFDGLAELLERCSDHLGRLDYYVQGGMDARLSKVAATQLLLFVRICDAALKLRYSVSEKIKTGLKIAFLGGKLHSRTAGGNGQTG